MTDPAPHLTWAELLRGSGRARPEELPQAVIAALRNTARLLWTPIRGAWGKPLVVLSGYRTPEANRKCRGAPRSQHLLGTALDLVPPDRDQTGRLLKLADALRAGGSIPKGGTGLYLDAGGGYRFLHLDIRGTNCRWTSRRPRPGVA